MKPRVSFVKDLKRIDKDLDVVWSPAMEIFCVYYKNPAGITFKVLEVREEDGSYRPLDNRTLHTLRVMDQWKQPGTAADIAKKEYDRIKEMQRKNRTRIIQDRKYKGKQLTSFWRMAAARMYDQKRYSEKPLKPLIMAMRRARLLNATSADLLGKYGLPNLKGSPLKINRNP